MITSSDAREATKAEHHSSYHSDQANRSSSHSLAQTHPDQKAYRQAAIRRLPASTVRMAQVVELPDFIAKYAKANAEAQCHVQ
jgi:hypothetical protein